MDSFQAIIGCKMMRNRESKNYPSVSFLPNVQQKIPKKQEKIKKYNYEFISSQNRLEKDGKKRK